MAQVSQVVTCQVMHLRLRVLLRGNAASLAVCNKPLEGRYCQRLDAGLMEGYSSSAVGKFGRLGRRRPLQLAW